MDDGCVFFAISGRVQLLQSGYESINLRFPGSIAWPLGLDLTSSASGRMQEHQADYEGRKLEISFEICGILRVKQYTVKHAKTIQTC